MQVAAEPTPPLENSVSQADAADSHTLFSRERTPRSVALQPRRRCLATSTICLHVHLIDRVPVVHRETCNFVVCQRRLIAAKRRTNVGASAPEGMPVALVRLRQSPPWLIRIESSHREHDGDRRLRRLPGLAGRRCSLARRPRESDLCILVQPSQSSPRDLRDRHRLAHRAALCS